MISAMKMESGNKHKMWSLVAGSDAVDRMCQNKTTMNQTFNLFCITISLFEHLELLELRATSTVVLFCVVSL